MSYLGKVDMNDANIKHYSLTSSTLTTVDIGWVPPSEQSLRVTINGVVQQGGSFSLSGSNLTLGGPLVATDDLEVIGIQSVGNIIIPADNSVTTGKIADDSVTLAKMAGGTDGNLITYDASGDPAYVLTGAATEVLTSNGAGAAPTFQAGGKVVGFAKYELAATQETSTSTSWVSTSLTISYTPVSSSNHLIISTNTSAASLRPTQYHTESFFRIRNTTDGVTVAEREAGLETAAGVVSNDSNPKWSQHIMGYDTGRSVATTYVLQYAVSVGSSDVAYIGRGPSDSLITVMEISA